MAWECPGDSEVVQGAEACQAVTLGGVGDGLSETCCLQRQEKHRLGRAELPEQDSSSQGERVPVETFSLGKISNLRLCFSCAICWPKSQKTLEPIYSIWKLVSAREAPLHVHRSYQHLTSKPDEKLNHSQQAGIFTCSLYQSFSRAAAEPLV